MQNKNKILFLLNSLVLALIFIVLFFVTGGEIFNFGLTGYSFVDFYDSEVMYTLNAISGEEMVFVIPIVNQRDEILMGVYAVIEIYDLDNNKMGEVESDIINVKANGESQLRVLWRNNVLPGNYVARIFLSSQDGDANFVKSFKIEQKSLTIESVLVNDFAFDEIVNLDVLVENHLSEVLRDVVANLLIYNDDGEIITNLRSTPDSVDAISTKRLVLKWDSSGIEAGGYNAKLVVEGGDYSVEKDLVFNIDEEGLTIRGVGFAINYRQERNNDMLYLGIIFVVLLVAVNVIIITVFLRKKNNQEK